MNVLVTGGSKGIGKELVCLLSKKEGAKVFFTYNKGPVDKNLPDNVKAIQCDLSDEKQVAELLKTVSPEDIDVLVNNAFEKPVWEPVYKMDWNHVQRSIDVGVRSAFELSKAIGRSMKKRKSGTIINVLSAVVSGAGSSQMPAYVIAKYAQLGLHEALKVELEKSGVNVYSVAPAMVDTGFISELPEHYINLNREQMPDSKLTDARDVAGEIVSLLG